MDRRDHGKLQFGVFELDPGSGELRKHGIKIRIQDQPLKVLLALLERPREIVTREELRQNIWPADTFVDFDQSLNKAVNKIREALSDSPGSRICSKIVAAVGCCAIGGHHRRAHCCFSCNVCCPVANYCSVGPDQ